MKHLRSLNFAICLLIAAALSACASLGMQTPDTFNKRVAAAYLTVQTIAETATAAVNTGKLSKADAANVVTTSRAALAAIGVASGLYATNPQAGEDKLAATLAILVALQSYVATQQGVK